jgi:hypothetical protein
MCVLYLIGGTWHEVMSMPHFIWEPIQARLAEMAGDRAEFRFEVEGREHHAQATFGTAEIRLELAGTTPSERPPEGPSASLRAEAAP